MEHLTVELSSSGDLLRVFYGAHGTKDGRWIKASNVPMETVNGAKKIVAYIALNGHGLYPSDGTVFRFGGMANDITEKAIQWIPKPIVILNKEDPNFNIDTMGWSVYNSRIGGNSTQPNTEGITGLPDKSWMHPIDNLIDTFYSPPPLFNKTVSTINNTLSKIGGFIIIYIIIIYLMPKLTRLFTKDKIKNQCHSLSIVQHIFIIILSILFYILFRKGGNTLINKFVPDG